MVVATGHLSRGRAGENWPGGKLRLVVGLVYKSRCPCMFLCIYTWWMLAGRSGGQGHSSRCCLTKCWVSIGRLPLGWGTPPNPLHLHLKAAATVKKVSWGVSFATGPSRRCGARR